MNEIIIIGRMDNSDGTLELWNKVYSVEGLAPTINCVGGGNILTEKKEQTKDIIVLGEMDHTLDGSFECRNRVHSRGGCAPTIQTAQFVYTVEELNETT